MNKFCYLLMNHFSHNLSPVKWSSSPFTSRPLKWIWRSHTKRPSYRESTISDIHSNCPFDLLISILAILLLDSFDSFRYSWTGSRSCYLDPSTGTVNKRSGPSKRTPTRPVYLLIPPRKEKEDNTYTSVVCWEDQLR